MSTPGVLARMRALHANHDKKYGSYANSGTVVGGSFNAVGAAKRKNENEQQAKVNSPFNAVGAAQKKKENEEQAALNAMQPNGSFNAVGEAKRKKENEEQAALNAMQHVLASPPNTEEHLVEHKPKKEDFELTDNCLIEYSINDYKDKIITCYNLLSLPKIVISNNWVLFRTTNIMNGELVLHYVTKKNMFPSSEIFMNKVLKLMNINQSSSVYLNSEETVADKNSRNRKTRKHKNRRNHTRKN